MQTVQPISAAAPRRAGVNLPRWVIAPLVAFVLTRVLVFGVVLLGDTLLPGFNDTVIFDGGSASEDYLQAWHRWDTVWYVQIAEQGYTYIPGEPRNTVVYFPMLPLLMALLRPLTGSVLLSALIVNNACFLVGLIMLYRLTERLTGDAGVANRTVFYMAAVPYAFFFSAAYTEGLFLLFSVTAFWFGEQRRWWAAALMIALASATRAPGILMIPALALMWAASHGGLMPALRRDFKSLVVLGLGVSGFVAYLIYQGVVFGDPLATVKAQTGWRQPMGLMPLINDITLMLQGQLWPGYIVDLAAMIFAALMTIPIWRRLGAPYGVYTILSVLLPAASGVMSFARYSLMIFPVFIVLAMWGQRRWVDLPLRVIFLALLPVCTLLFLKWVFIG